MYPEIYFKIYFTGSETIQGEVLEVGVVLLDKFDEVSSCLDITIYA